MRTIKEKAGSVGLSVMSDDRGVQIVTSDGTTVNGVVAFDVNAETDGFAMATITVYLTGLKPHGEDG